MHRKLHLVNPCANGAAMAFGLLTALRESPEKSLALQQLSEVVSMRASIFGPGASGYTQASLRMAKAFADNVRQLSVPSILTNLAFYGADAMRLLCLCTCNKLQAVDKTVMTGRTEEAALVLLGFLEPLQSHWDDDRFDDSQIGLKEQSEIWTSQLRRVAGSLELADSSSPFYLPFRRLREATHDDCCLLPVRDGWIVTTFPTEEGEMFTIGEGRDVPQAVADALTSQLSHDAEANT